MTRIALAVVVGWAALSAGCAPSDMAPVSGVVTLDGKPVAGATVVFQLQPEGAPVSNGVTDAQGKFTLETGDDERIAGAKIGVHAVAVRKLELEGVTPTDDGLSGFAPVGTYREVWHTPKKYGDIRNPKITIEVKPGMEPVAIKLESDPVETE